MGELAELAPSRAKRLKHQMSTSKNVLVRTWSEPEAVIAGVGTPWIGRPGMTGSFEPSRSQERTSRANFPYILAVARHPSRE